MVIPKPSKGFGITENSETSENSEGSELSETSEISDKITINQKDMRKVLSLSLIHI